MALNKAKTVTRPDSTTATGSYWQISKFDADKKNMTVTWTIQLFVSRAAAKAGATSMGPTYTLKASVTKPEMNGDLSAIGYTKIKAKIAGAEPTEAFPKDGFTRAAWTDLQGAVDVIETA